MPASPTSLRRASPATKAQLSHLLFLLSAEIKEDEAKKLRTGRMKKMKKMRMKMVAAALTTGKREDFLLKSQIDYLIGPKPKCPRPKPN